MQKIRFTYTSSDIDPSVFLLLFFRMVGIYVYECFYDSTVEKKEALLSAMPYDKVKSPVTWSDFDLDLYFARTEEEYIKARALNKKFDVKKGVFIVSDAVVKEGDLVSDRITGYSESGIDLLQTLLSTMQQLDIIDDSVLEQLCICADIYTEHKLWELTLKSKYFYTAEENKYFNKIMEGYRVITDSLIQQLREHDSYWGDERFLYLQYAVLNIGYEGNQYCDRNKKNMWYSSQDLADICEELLDNQLIADVMSDSIYLLLAQIYDDLLKDPNTAYRYYELSCKDYNAYSYFKKGCFWQDYARNNKRAIKYYSKSTRIYPEYYRAWYRMGCCYMEMSDCPSALNMFRNVSRILAPRLNENSIRPMEIEYLFKAHNQCGYIWNKFYNNVFRSMASNLNAIHAWEAIDKSVFFERLLGEEYMVAKERTKRELNVDKIRLEMSKLVGRK